MTQSIGATAASAEFSASGSVSGFTTNQTSNVVLVVCVFSSGSESSTYYSISDTAGLSWTHEFGPGTDEEMDMFYASAPSGVSNDTITITRSTGGPGHAGFLIVELDGTQASVDPTTAGYQSNMHTAAVTCTTSNANDIVLFFFMDEAGGSAGTVTYNNSYTEAVKTTAWGDNVGNYCSIAYLVVSAAGSQSQQNTLSGSWGGSNPGWLIGFKAGASGANYSKSVSDSFTLSEIFSKSATHKLMDAFSLLSETFAKKITHKVVNSIALVELFTKKGIITVSDSFGLSDLGVSIKKLFFLALSDSFALSDTIHKKISKTVSESFSLLDSLKKKITHKLTESFAFTERITRKVAHTFAIETFSLVESFVVHVVRVVTFNDSFTLADLGIKRKLTHGISEAISLIDKGLVRKVTLNLSEAFSLLDSIKKKIAHAFGLETIVLTDRPISGTITVAQVGVIIGYLSQTEGIMTLSASEGKIILSIEEI